MSIGKKHELLFGIKLKNAILMRRRKKANKTTPSPTWKLGFSNSSSPNPHFSMKSSVSARKIGANLWEVQPQFNFNKIEGHPDRDGDGDRDRGADLIHNHRRRHHEKEGFQVSDQLDEEISGSDPHTPEIKTTLRRNIRKLPSSRHLSIREDEDLQHVSSGSCCSSMQVTPYACAITPTGYTFKTSTHLLKVLNRIWTLEEQHSSNVASIKVLKHELDISRAQIKTLIEERKNDHKEINELKKSTQEKKKKAAQSTYDEISDTKSSLIGEKKARILLESLCDEFAKGIRDYEQKVRALQKNHGRKDVIEPDRLILHVSEAWLDERAQMKCDLSEKTSISDNLCCEIETFLEAKKKQSRGSKVKDDGEPSSRVVSRMVDRGQVTGEPSSKSMSRMADQGQARAREGVRSNTLMSKLLEARLESQLLKSKSKKVV